MNCINTLRCSLLVATVWMHWAYAAPLKVATPEGVGMSSERLLRVGTFSNVCRPKRLPEP